MISPTFGALPKNSKGLGGGNWWGSCRGVREALGNNHWTVEVISLGGRSPDGQILCRWKGFLRLSMRYESLRDGWGGFNGRVGGKKNKRCCLTKKKGRKWSLKMTKQTEGRRTERRDGGIFYPETWNRCRSTKKPTPTFRFPLLSLVSHPLSWTLRHLRQEMRCHGSRC